MGIITCFTAWWYTSFLNWMNFSESDWLMSLLHIADGAWVLLYKVTQSQQQEEYAQGLDSWEVPKANLMFK